MRERMVQEVVAHCPVVSQVLWRHVWVSMPMRPGRCNLESLVPSSSGAGACARSPSGAMMSYTACSSCWTSSLLVLFAVSASCVWKCTLQA